MFYIPLHSFIRNLSVNSLNWRRLLFYSLPPILALCTVFQVDFKTDLSAFVISGNNAEEILLASEMQSGALSRRYLLSIGKNSSTKKPSPPVSKAFIQSLILQLNVIDGVVDVWDPKQQSDITQALQTVYSDYANALYSLNPEQDLEHLFSTDGLNQRAALVKSLLLSPQGVLFKKIILQDPLLLTLKGFQSLADQMQEVIEQDEEGYRNLVLETRMAGLDARQQSRIQTSIKSVFETLNHSTSAQYTLEMTGVPIFAVATQTLMQGDITKVSILSTLILTLIFCLLFRSFTVMLKVFTLLIIVILSAILMTQFVFGYVHGMTIAMGATLVGICIDYPIHTIVHAQAVRFSERIRVTATLWPSMVLGGITTIIGYIALGSSGYPGFQQVAVFASSGIIISLLLTRFVLPRLMTEDKTSTLRVPLVKGWSQFTLQYRKGLIGCLILFIALSSLNLKSLHWMTDMQELTPELNYLKQNDQRIRARMSSIEPGRFVMVTGDNTELALQKAELVYPLLDQLKQSGVLKGYMGLYPWLLSLRQQKSNQTLLQRYLTQENLQTWRQALNVRGLSVSKLGALNYSGKEALQVTQLLESPLSKLIDSRIVLGKNQTIIMIWLGQHQPEAVRLAMQNIQGAQYFSQRDMLNNMTRDYTQRAQRLLMVGVSMIVILLLGRYKSIVKTIQTLLPAVLAAFLILIVWSFTGEAVSFLHLVGFLLVIAICVDYGIFYQENRSGDLALTYQAMAVSMLTSVVAFGSLAVAESTSLRILSAVVAFGVMLGFILCPLIIHQNEKV